ncbi:hypothetical protein NDU88_003659 [Pleurodeles waltl]|uniref:Uncharacterized protein n=1 Tax=Pleurodeles waltl TaxID=8319 RepID=A0AAV7LJI4_PLEWA|nr:hypothetical protein NDU88_003659 [Pleurodeles waltl]
MKAKPERRRKRSSVQIAENRVLRPAGRQTSENALEMPVATRALSRRYGGMKGMSRKSTTGEKRPLKDALHGKQQTRV